MVPFTREEEFNSQFRPSIARNANTGSTFFDNLGSFLNKHKDSISQFGDALPVLGNYLLSRNAANRMSAPLAPTMRSRVTYDKNMDTGAITSGIEQQRAEAYRSASTIADPKVANAIRRKADSAYFRQMMEVNSQKANFRKELESQEGYVNAFVDQDNVRSLNAFSDMSTGFENQRTYNRASAGLNALAQLQMLKAQKNQRAVDLEAKKFGMSMFSKDVLAFLESLTKK